MQIQNHDRLASQDGETSDHCEEPWAAFKIREISQECRWLPKQAERVHRNQYNAEADIKIRKSARREPDPLQMRRDGDDATGHNNVEVRRMKSFDNSAKTTHLSTDKGSTWSTKQVTSLKLFDHA
jgi:hypothetical protein